MVSLSITEHAMSRLFLFPLILGCAGEGEWSFEAYGQDFIAVEIPAEEFDDGCSVSFSTFAVRYTGLTLLTGDGAVVAEIPGSFAVDLAVEDVAHTLGSAAVPAQRYTVAGYQIAAGGIETNINLTDEDLSEMDSGQLSYLVRGEISCPSASVVVDWAFATSAQHECEPDDLAIPAGGVDTTESTLHADHLFYNSLAEHSEVLGEPIVQADADGDGQVTREELAAVSLADLGYSVGSFTGIYDLDAFLEVQMTTLGHVDGEGHCSIW